MNKGTIIYIGGFELPDRNAAAQRVLANSSIFRDLGYNVVFVGTSRNVNETGMQNPQFVNGYTCYNVFYPKSLSDQLKYLTSISLIKSVLKLYNDARAVICYNYQAVALWKIKRYCKKQDVKVIGDTTEWYQPKGSVIYRTIKNLDTNLRMRVIQPKLDGLIATSRFLFDFYKDKNPNLLVLPALVDLNDNKWSVEIEEHNDNCVRLVYAGTTGIGKDELAETLNILAKVKRNCNRDFIINIIGLTMDQYRQAFHVSDIPEEIKDNVKFMGRLSHKQVIREIANSDFYIFIRNVSLVTSAGFPTKFSESISCGTPVITTKTSDLQSYLVEGKNGFFVDMCNTQKVIEQIKNIIELPQKKVEEMKKYCNDFNKMDYRNFIKETIEFQKKVGV